MNDFEMLRLKMDVSDEEFNLMYNDRIRKLDRRHWTSIAIAQSACEFLVQRPGTAVLDIGSGVGKFCMVSAASSEGHFTGVEQRLDLFELSNKLAQQYNIENVNFIHANITSISFNDFDAFYFYNSFFENLVVKDKIDEKLKSEKSLYNIYSSYVFKQFASLKVGARIVTYCSPTKIIPRSYKMISSSRGGLLKFWMKQE
jgi:tRNA A58 N-methylase Trm61